MALELIKISEFPEVNEPANWIPVADANGEGYRISQDNFKAWLGTVTVITDKPIALADPAPTVDGVYLPTESGTYTNAGGLVYDPEGVDAGKYVQFIKNDTVWTKLAVDLPTAPVADVVIEGGEEATSQDAVFKNNIIVAVNNGANPANIEAGLISSTGVFTTAVDWKRIKNIPAFNGVPITITGIRPSGSKRIALYSGKDGSGFISIVGTVAAENTFTPSGLPVNGGYLAVTIKTDTEADDATAFPALKIEYANAPTSYKAYDGKMKVIKASQTEIEASYLKSGTKLGDKDIATEDFVNDNAVTNDDLEVTEPVNLADPSKRTIGSFIDSSGNKLTGAGWSMIEIDTSSYPVGQKITISNMVIASGHAAWYDGATKVEYAGVYSTSTLPVTFEKPANGNSLFIDDMRSNIENPSTMVNLGDVALPYQPYHPPKLSKVKGYEIEGGSGEAYDQSLNTTDSVTFAKVTALAMSFPLPEGAGSPPPEVLVGDGWIDTTDGSIKVRLS